MDLELYGFGESVSISLFFSISVPSPSPSLLIFSLKPLNLLIGLLYTSPFHTHLLISPTANLTKPTQPFWFLFKYYPASPTDHAIASKNLKQLTALLESGTVRPVRHRLVAGGLETGLAKGFEEMKAGRVRGEKLVVRVGGGE